MKNLPGKCPICGENLTVTRIHCRNCDTTIEGQFSLGVLELLSKEQLLFVETFVRCEGKLNRMEKEMGLSYPTLRSRLTELIRAMGYEVGQEESLPVSTGISDEERRRILEDLAAGRLSSEQAVKALQGG
jgi:hypothetical protein